MKHTLLELSELDADLTSRIRLQPGSWRWQAAALLAHSGDSWLWAAGVGLVWLLVRDPFWHRLAAILEISIVVQALLIFAIKMKIRRRRPEGNWGGIYRQFDPHSFPSGHATRAVLLAVVSAALGPAWLGWLISLWAPLVCLSRITTGLHYVSDILGGVVLGLLMGFLMVGIHPALEQILPFLF